MAVSAGTLERELKALIRERGLHAANLDKLTGPALRELLRLSADDGSDVIRQRLQTWVTEAIKELPPDLKAAVMVAFSIDSRAQHEFLGERLDWLAAREQRDRRTMRRRVDRGLLRLVQAAGRTAPAALRDDTAIWHLRRLSSSLRLDGPTPTCVERRVIVATGSVVDRITWSISVPRAAGELPRNLDVRVLHGAILLHAGHVSPHRFQMHLELPKPLANGETHEFRIGIRVPPGQPMRPTYVFWPERRCERFDLTTQFDPRRPPSLVWRVNDAFHRDTDDLAPSSDLLTVDGAGRIAVSFTEPRCHRGYGIQWRM